MFACLRWQKPCSMMSVWSIVRAANTLLAVMRCAEKAFAAGPTASSTSAPPVCVPTTAPETALICPVNARPGRMFCLAVPRASAMWGDCDFVWTLYLLLFYNYEFLRSLLQLLQMPVWTWLSSEQFCHLSNVWDSLYMPVCKCFTLFTDHF